MPAESKSTHEVLAELQDEMVQRAEQVVRELAQKPRGEGSRQEESRSGRTQTSRAIDVASGPGCTPKVFINWLRYQAAREADRDRFWAEQLSGSTRVADRVSEHVNWIVGRVRELRGTPDNETAMLAIARFLGYFRRALVAAGDMDRISLGSGGGSQ